MRDDEAAKAAQLLSSMIEMAGLTRREMDERMGEGRGYTRQVLTRQIRLEPGHVSRILEALGADPEAFFRILSPDSADRAGGAPLMERFLGRLQRAGYDEGAPAAPPPAPAADWAELDRRVQAAIATAVAGPAPKRDEPPKAEG